VRLDNTHPAHRENMCLDFPSFRVPEHSLNFILSTYGKGTVQLRDELIIQDQ
jgi:hypothetical protein